MTDVYIEKKDKYEIRYEFMHLKKGVKLIHCTGSGIAPILLEIIVPVSICGKPVISIGAECFNELVCDKLVFQNEGKYHFSKRSLANTLAKEIIIPKNITVIPEELFLTQKL